MSMGAEGPLQDHISASTFTEISLQPMKLHKGVDKGGGGGEGGAKPPPPPLVLSKKKKSSRYNL